MNFEKLFFNASLYGVLLIIVVSVIAIIQKKMGLMTTNKEKTSESFIISEKLSLIITIILLICISLSIIIRTLKAGHGPFTSMYEFSIAFVWGIFLMSIYFSWKYRNIVLNLASIIVAGILLLYASTLSAESTNLVPALQNSILLSAHVASAVIAYGAFTIGFISSIFFFIQRDNRLFLIPNSKSLEKISYHSVIIGFPFMTLVIVLGALWADIAWGTYWSWDPKETASLITWLIYAAYLHTRITRDWRGKKTALILILGFTAVIFTFLGNYLFNGLHSYL